MDSVGTCMQVYISFNCPDIVEPYSMLCCGWCISCQMNNDNNPFSSSPSVSLPSANEAGGWITKLQHVPEAVLSQFRCCSPSECWAHSQRGKLRMGAADVGDDRWRGFLLQPLPLSTPACCRAVAFRSAFQQILIQFENTFSKCNDALSEIWSRFFASWLVLNISGFEFRHKIDGPKPEGTLMLPQ